MLCFLCFLPLKRTDIETKKTLEILAGHVQAPQREETVSVAYVLFIFFFLLPATTCLASCQNALVVPFLLL